MCHVVDRTDGFRGLTQVDTAQDYDAVLQRVGQFFSLAHSFVIFAEMPLVERSPRRFEEELLEVELERVAEKDIVAEKGHVELERKERLVDHGHRVVGETKYSVVDV